MPQFTDEWLIDRVLFDYISGGSCACCGFQHFAGGSTADLIQAVSDLETDQAEQEIQALQNHPWPADLRDQIWADRIRLRQKLKREMNAYKVFWEEQDEDLFREWSISSAARLQKLSQVSRSEIMELLREKYNIHSAYGVVLCQVVEQIVNFQKTGYPLDSNGEVEAGFENILSYNRRGGFFLPIVGEDGDPDQKNLERWFDRMKTLGGPSLLERAKSTHTDDGSEEGEIEDNRKVSAWAPGFRSDRRLVRLVIARWFADLWQQNFLKDNPI